MARFQLPSDWRVPDLFNERLGDTVGRQRAMTADGHLLLILHEVPKPGVPERSGRVIWREPDGAWHSKGLGQGAQGLARHVVEFADRVDELEEQWRHARTARDFYALLRAIGPLHRTIRNLHAVLQEARSMIPEERELINLRDRAGEIERAVELLHGDVKNGLDFTIAHQAELQAERTHAMAVAGYRLNLLAAAFFPVATLAAIFGMNLTHGLDGWNTPAHFWGILGAVNESTLIVAVSAGVVRLSSS
jgi:hypothetical protein